MKNLCIIIFLFLVLTLNAEAQPVTWQRVLEYTDNSALYKAHQTSDGGYIAVGNNRIGGYGKIMLVKFNKYGDTLWNKYFDLSVNSVFSCTWIEETNDKGFIITGAGPGISTDSYLIKTDSSGNIQWHKTFGGSDLDQGTCVKQLPDNGFIILIRTFSYSSTTDILLIRTDSAGNEIWKKIYGNNTGDELGEEIQLIKNSGFIIAGWKSISGQSSNLYLIRTDLNGEPLWTKTYNNFLSSGAYSIDLTNDNGFIIGGTADSTVDERKAYVIRADSNGSIVWQKRYSSAYKEYCFSIRTMLGNRFAFCGMSDSTYFNYERAILRIIDGEGNILMEKYYRSGMTENAFQSVELTNDGGFILCGYSEYVLAESFIVRTDSLGYIKPIGIQNNFEMIREYFIDQNYPNPFNSQTIIRYYMLKPAYIKINLYDVTGKYIATILNEYKSSGSYNYVFDPLKYNLSSGIYFYNYSVKLSSNTLLYSNSSKMLYLK